MFKIFSTLSFLCVTAVTQTASAIQADSLSKSLDEIVITGTRSETSQRNLPYNVTTINKTQLENSFSSSVLPALNRLVPGLFVTERGILGYSVSTGAAGGMTIRGIGGTTATSGVLVLIDGEPQYMGLMAHPIADAYQNLITERAEVISGPASTVYGSNAMGGVINLITRQPLVNGSNTHARIQTGSYNTWGAQVIQNISKNRFSSTIGLSYDQTDGHRKNMDFKQYSSFFKLGYDFSNHWKATANISLTHYDSESPGELSKPLNDFTADITRGMANAALENRYKKANGAIRFFYNWGDHKINDGYAPEERPLDFNYCSQDRMLGISMYETVHLIGGNRTTLGIDYQKFGGKAWNAYHNGDRKDLANKTQNEIAGYVTTRQQLFNHLVLDAGIRFDHHQQSGSEWIPQAGISYAFKSHSVLKASASKGFRNPTIKEMYMFPPQNPDLKPERLWSYELSFSQQHQHFNYKAAAFYIRGDNLIIPVPYNGKKLNMNTGEVENWGVEFSGAYDINSHLQFTANYSWLHMVHAVPASPEHKLYAGLDYHNGRWNVSTACQYIKSLYTTMNSKKTEDFVLWNARCNYRFNSMLSVFIKGENLLAQKYEINAGYPMPRATVMAGFDLRF